jgi:hypothetical protein
MGCGEAGGKVTPVEPGDIVDQTTDIVAAIETGPTLIPQVAALDFHDDVAFGHIPGYYKVNKFGRNPAVTGATYEVVSLGGLYQTPTTAQVLEFVSSSTVDALDQNGMRELTIQGLDASWEEQIVTVAAHATNGQTAVPVPGTWLRVYRAYVSSSGLYASSITGSHIGTITIRGTGGGVWWCGIDAADFPRGQSETAAYTVPLGKTAIVHDTRVSVSGVTTTKTTNVIFFQRPNANDVTTPFGGIMREISTFTGLDNGQYSRGPAPPWGKFTGPCDIGFLAKVSSGSGEIECEFDMVLEDTHV